LPSSLGRGKGVIKNGIRGDSRTVLHLMQAPLPARVLDSKGEKGKRDRGRARKELKTWLPPELSCRRKSRPNLVPRNISKKKKGTRESSKSKGGKEQRGILTLKRNWAKGCLGKSFLGRVERKKGLRKSKEFRKREMYPWGGAPLPEETIPKSCREMNGTKGGGGPRLRPWTWEQ